MFRCLTDFARSRSLYDVQRKHMCIILYHNSEFIPVCYLPVVYNSQIVSQLWFLIKREQNIKSEKLNYLPQVSKVFKVYIKWNQTVFLSLYIQMISFVFPSFFSMSWYLILWHYELMWSFLNFVLYGSVFICGLLLSLTGTIWNTSPFLNSGMLFIWKGEWLQFSQVKWKYNFTYLFNIPSVLLTSDFVQS